MVRTARIARCAVPVPCNIKARVFVACGVEAVEKKPVFFSF
jgi:hypothetical protein